MKSHNEYRDQFHTQSKDMGWWANSHLGHIKPVKMMLIVSEVSEADTADGPDDKLPQYPGRGVELADAAIRLYDLLGWYKKDIPSELPHSSLVALLGSEAQHLLVINEVSAAMEADRKGLKQLAADHLTVALAFVWSIAMVNHFDLVEIMEAKIEFNRNRPDHQPEQRSAANGKAY